MVIVVDLQGCKTKEEVLKKFGETFKFKIEGMDNPSWGMNWDALNDCLGNLETTTTNEYKYPLYVVVQNGSDFWATDKKGDDILWSVLRAAEDESRGRIFVVRSIGGLLEGFFSGTFNQDFKLDHPSWEAAVDEYKGWHKNPEGKKHLIVLTELITDLIDKYPDDAKLGEATYKLGSYYVATVDHASFKDWLKKVVQRLAS